MTRKVELQTIYYSNREKARECRWKIEQKWLAKPQELQRAIINSLWPRLRSKNLRFKKKESENMFYPTPSIPNYSSFSFVLSQTSLTLTKFSEKMKNISTSTNSNKRSIKTDFIENLMELIWCSKCRCIFYEPGQSWRSLT